LWFPQFGRIISLAGVTTEEAFLMLNRSNMSFMLTVVVLTFVTLTCGAHDWVTSKLPALPDPGPDSVIMIRLVSPIFTTHHPIGIAGEIINRTGSSRPSLAVM